MAIQDYILRGIGSAPAGAGWSVTRGIQGGSRFRYRLEIDWDNDGDYRDAGENVTGDVYRLECQLGRDSSSQLTGRAVAGRFKATLKNQDGTYSPLNASSPLAGNLVPRRKLRFRATQPVAGTFWTGWIDSIIPEAPGFGEAPLVKITAVGALQLLVGKRINPPSSSGDNTGNLVDDALDAAAWGSGDRDIDTGLTVTGRWFVQDKDATEAIRELEETELGFFYEDTDGNLVYEGRGHRLVNDHQISQATFTDDPDAELRYEGIQQEDPLREIFNEFPVTIRSFTVQALATIWTLNVASNPTLAAGESVTYWALYPSPDTPAGAYVEAWATPVVGADVTQTGVSNGDIGIAVSKFAQTMKITITNNHGADAATLTLVSAQGTAVTQDDPVRVLSEDTDSQTAYGKRTWRLPGKWYASPDDALTLADSLRDRYKDPSPLLSVVVVPDINLAMRVEAVTRKISDRVTVEANRLTGLGLDSGDFFIESIRHVITTGPYLHRTTYELSSAAAVAGSWILGISTLGVDTRLTA